MINGDLTKDNNYIQAVNFRDLTNIVPEDVKKLINKSSEEKTYQNLVEYRKETNDNFVYGLLNWFHPYFSISSLESISAKRLGSSDMLEIRYSADDPGVAHQTLLILNEVLGTEYTKLQLSSSEDVIKYFENQLEEIRKQLNFQEDSLLQYSMQGNIINYEEQTSSLTALSSEIDSRYEQALIDYNTSDKLIKNLESQMDERGNLLKENKKFLQNLEVISMLTKKITEIETTNDETSSIRSDKLPRYKELLKKAEQKTFDLSNNISTIKTSKEGLNIDLISQNWLTETLKNEKAKAELATLKDRKKEIKQDYVRYTPIGPNLKKQEREISITEESYHTILNHLSQARLQQKNIQMMSATLSVVSQPIYPLAAVPSKRKLIIVLAFFCSLIFIITCFLLVELMDKTIRDKARATSLTKTQVIGAFPGIPKLKHRGYAMETNRRATAYACNRLIQHFNSSGTTIINLLSSNPLEGKSHIAQQFKQYWEELGFDVKLISHNKDFDVNSKEYLMADSFENLCPPENEKKHDIIIIEYPPLSQCSISKKLLQSGNVNLFIVKATRAWRDIDQTFLDMIKSQTSDVPTYLYLNYAQRFAVEDFTGQLPPYTKIRNLSYKLLQMELTPERDQNMEKN